MVNKWFSDMGCESVEGIEARSHGGYIDDRSSMIVSNKLGRLIRKVGT